MAILGVAVLATFGGYLLDSSYRRRERSFDRREKAWESERRQLLNRVMYVQGRPWEGPPEFEEAPPATEDEQITDPLLEAL